MVNFPDRSVIDGSWAADPMNAKEPSSLSSRTSFSHRSLGRISRCIGTGVAAHHIYVHSIENVMDMAKCGVGIEVHLVSQAGLRQSLVEITFCAMR